MAIRALKPVVQSIHASQVEFCENLRFACGYYRSVAEVCRKLEINRAQFNRYLNGSTTPSSFILQKICDFFGLEPTEIYLPHNQFRKLIEVRQEQKPTYAPYVEHVERLQEQSQGKFDRYLGYYFEYYNSMTVYGRVIRGLVRIFKEGNGVYYERFERFPQHANLGEVYRMKYLGCAFYLNDRIFLVDYESLSDSEITQTVLFPDYKKKLQRLSGLMLGVSSGNQRPIACARIVFEYLGTDIDLRKAARKCGILDPKVTEIDPTILRVIDNSVHTNHHHFCTLAD
ncbi:MAG TPA: helix-turn-helix transcriptional regulator [Burkholderiaceae bacterium]|jgi:transcriptional regulator with XRE-family HTH domain|nr:helix-turn-helix transcriptional regulator [Burkholderiaceae bacterium]